MMAGHHADWGWTMQVSQRKERTPELFIAQQVQCMVRFAESPTTGRRYKQSHGRESLRLTPSRLGLNMRDGALQEPQNGQGFLTRS